MSTDQRIALLLIDHGSRRSESNAQLVDMATRVRQLRPDDLIGHAHMELSEPSIDQAVDALVAQGATDIRALMYFLSDGRHSRDDVPRLVAAAVARHAGVSASVAPALGPHDLLAQLLLERAGLWKP